MSSYRPKSLDELNSRYDQAIAADRAIKKGVSGFELQEEKHDASQSADDLQQLLQSDEAFTDSDTFAAKSVEDISQAVDAFIRRFSQPAPENTPQAQQAMHTPQPTANVKKSVYAPPAENTRSVQRPAVTQDPVFEERTDHLMADYVKVMTDQYDDDEDDFPVSERSTLRKKKKHRSKAAKRSAAMPLAEPVPTQAAEPADSGFLPESEPIPQQSYNSPENTPPADFNGYDDGNVFSGEDSQAYHSNNDGVETLDSAFSRLDNQAEEKNPKKRGSKRKVFRVILSLVLVLALAATVGAASLELVFKVNTGEEVLGGYYFVTTGSDLEEANLQAGDLVICEKAISLSDGIYALCVNRENGTFFFGKKSGGITDTEGNVLYLIDGQSVYRENVLGTVKRSFGSLGNIIDIILNQYILMLAVLLVLDIALILLITVALRDKSKAKKNKRAKSVRNKSDSVHIKADKEKDSEADDAPQGSDPYDNDDYNVFAEL